MGPGLFTFQSPRHLPVREKEQEKEQKPVNLDAYQRSVTSRVRLLRDFETLKLRNEDIGEGVVQKSLDSGSSDELA